MTCLPGGGAAVAGQPSVQLHSFDQDRLSVVIAELQDAVPYVIQEVVSCESKQDGRDDGTSR